MIQIHGRPITRVGRLELEAEVEKLQKVAEEGRRLLSSIRAPREDNERNWLGPFEELEPLDEALAAAGYPTPETEL